MLKKINDTSYVCMTGGISFALKYGYYGVCNNGKCWRLTMYDNGVNIHIACFAVTNDGYESYERREYCESRLWNENEIVPAANKMIENILS